MYDAADIEMICEKANDYKLKFENRWHPTVFTFYFFFTSFKPYISCQLHGRTYTNHKINPKCLIKVSHATTVQPGTIG